MSQKPYLSGTTTVLTGSTDTALLSTIFGASWQSTLGGSPNNIVIRFDRDVTYKIGATTNDVINPLNIYNKPSTISCQNFQNWYKQFPAFEIYVTNASGGTCTFYVDILPNRQESTNTGVSDFNYDNINGDASEATLLLILADTTAIRASVASIDTKSTSIVTNTGATATSAASIDTKLTTTNSTLSTISTNTGTTATNTTSIDTKLTTTNSTLSTISTNTSTTATNTGTIATNTGTTATNTGTIVTEIGATNETAPATDTATSGLNGRLQRIAQRLTTLISQWVLDNTTFTAGSNYLTPIAGQDGTNFQAILTDTSGAIVTTNFTNTTQSVAFTEFSENCTSGNNTVAKVTTPAGGSRNIYWDSNSSLRYQIRIGAGPQIITINAGSTGSIPCNIAGAVDIYIRPTSGNMVSGTDYVQVGVS